MAKKWTITLETGNAAFEDNATAEIARILRDFAARIERDGFPPEHLRDINGNRVGTVLVEH